jgi:hypothetical protein
MQGALRWGSAPHRSSLSPSLTQQTQVGIDGRLGRAAHI